MDNLLPGTLPEEIVFSCIPDDSPDEEIDVGAMSYEIGVYKAFKEKKYNQLEIDPYSCFMFAPFQALANYTGRDVSYDLMRKTFAKLKADGKFTVGKGGKMTDGLEYATRAFNEEYGENIKYKVVSLNTQTITDALKSGSPMVTGLYYSKTYFLDEQDGDAWITKAESIGNMGHLIAFVKINTLKDVLVKFLENYTGKVRNDIIGADFEKFRKLFFKTGAYFHR